MSVPGRKRGFARGAWHKAAHVGAPAVARPSAASLARYGASENDPVSRMSRDEDPTCTLNTPGSATNLSAVSL